MALCPAAMLDDVDKINESVSVAVADKVYTGKRGAYKSIPYVTVNGVLLKFSDYKVSYYKNVDREQVLQALAAYLKNFYKCNKDDIRQ